VMKATQHRITGIAVLPKARIEYHNSFYPVA
jgi:hypothetical protein